MSKETIFSIVTINLNNLNGLKDTINSILNQTFKHYEVIVIDGASDDGSQEYLLGLNCTRIRFFSEQDNGIYDAMNKGLTHITGNYVIFMNSGDAFFDTTVLAKVALITNHVDNKVVFGRAALRLSSGRTVLYPPSFITKSNVSFWLNYALPNHQSMFFPSAYCTQTRYRVDLNISSDSDFKIRAMDNLGFDFIDTTIAKFNLAGISSSFNISPLLMQCKDRLIREDRFGNYPGAMICLIKAIFKWSIYKMARENTDTLIYFIKSSYFWIIRLFWPKS